MTFAWWHSIVCKHLVSMAYAVCLSTTILRMRSTSLWWKRGQKKNCQTNSNSIKVNGKKLMNKLLECYWAYRFRYWFWYASAAALFHFGGTFRCNTFHSANDPNQYVRSHFFGFIFYSVYWNSRWKKEVNCVFRVRRAHNSNRLSSCGFVFSLASFWFWFHKHEIIGQ